MPYFEPKSISFVTFPIDLCSYSAPIYTCAANADASRRIASSISTAKSSLDKLGLGYIKVIGLAKRLEQVFISESNSPQNIAKTSPGIYLLRKIRDEVHRYSIAFHRKKRSNKLFDSILSNVEGIGVKRIKLLWSNYDSLKDILKASNQAISKKTGIPLKHIHSLKKVLKNEKELK